MIKKGKLGAIALIGAVGALLATAGYIKHREPMRTPALAAASSSPGTATSVANYGRIPISFEPNRGQSAGNMAFVARGPGFSLGLNAEGATVRLNRPVAKDMGSQATAVNPADKPAANAAPTVETTATLKLRLVGANKESALVAENKLPGVSHYLGRTGPSGPLTNIPHYGAVRYQQVYPGVDWLLYGNPMKLEYDFIVAPQADPALIRMRIDGADSLALDETGALLVTVAGQTVRQDKPLVYQERDGQLTAIEARYLLSQPSDAGATEVAFAVADYDRTRALVIDPVLVYSTYLGGAGDEAVSDFAVTDTGQLTITGTTTSMSFTSSSPLLSEREVFISQISADGTAVNFTTYLGVGGIPSKISSSLNGKIHLVGVGQLPAGIAPTNSPNRDCTLYKITFSVAGQSPDNAGCLPVGVGTYTSPIALTKSGSIYVLRKPPLSIVYDRRIATGDVGNTYLVEEQFTDESIFLEKIRDFQITESKSVLVNSGHYSKNARQEGSIDSSEILNPIWGLESDDTKTIISHSTCYYFSVPFGPLPINAFVADTNLGAAAVDEIHVIGADFRHFSGGNGHLYCGVQQSPINIAIGGDGNVYSSRIRVSDDFNSIVEEIVGPAFTKLIPNNGSSTPIVEQLVANSVGNVYYYNSLDSKSRKLNADGQKIITEFQAPPVKPKIFGNNQLFFANSTTSVEILDSGLQQRNNGNSDIFVRSVKVSDCINQNGSINLDSTNFSATESSGAVAISMTRSGTTDSDCDASISFSINNQSAQVGADFIVPTNTLRWSPGENSTKTITIPLVNDAVYELQESALLELRDAEGSALGSASSAVLLINDDDPKPAVRLSASTDSIPEVSGSVVITATLTDC